jgi:hypothetical protein
VTKSNRRTLDALDETLDVVLEEGRRRARLPVEEGGMNNMELIGFAKTLATIKVESLSLLEDDGDQSVED